jgi:hypothetical protein
MAVLYYLGLFKYTFAQRRNRLTTRFSERIPFVKRRTSVYNIWRKIVKLSLWIMEYRACRLHGEMKVTVGWLGWLLVL